jgi:hypothetical protein
VRLNKKGAVVDDVALRVTFTLAAFRSESLTAGVPSAAHCLLHRGNPNDPRFAQNATAIQRSRTIHDEWDFFNHE